MKPQEIWRLWFNLHPGQLIKMVAYITLYRSTKSLPLVNLYVIDDLATGSAEVVWSKLQIFKRISKY
jgi:hypothetical protein